MDLKSIFSTSQLNFQNPNGVVSGTQTSTPPIDTIAQNFYEVLKASEAASIGAMDGTVDSHSLVHAISQSQLAIETATSVRNRVVESYQEILRMPL